MNAKLTTVPTLPAHSNNLMNNAYPTKIVLKITYVSTMINLLIKPVNLSFITNKNVTLEISEDVNGVQTVLN
jgi:hypothetical protein